ncbi:MAG: tRNA uracil 4-sulfurtransferase ThiI [Candidatus Woesearchaeota archaeon]
MHTPRYHILVRYNEIFLKGQNRAFFEKQLAHNIKLCLKRHNISYERVNRHRGRIIIHLKEDIYEKSECLSKVFGIASFSPAVEIKRSTPNLMEEIKTKALQLLKEKGLSSSSSFKIAAKRSDKKFPIDSVHINEQVGAFIVEETGARVQLQNSEFYLGIEIVEQGEIYLFTEKIKGPGGLPTGSSGKLICLISGGIDSPVAAWLMMRKGCRVTLLHLDQSPYYSEGDLDRVKKVCSKLAEYYYGEPLKLCIIKTGRIMQEFVARGSKYVCVLCKSNMLRIASKLAEEEGASAVVDGSSLAQVASQTITNLEVEESASSKPVLRPLIGLSKEEIIQIAKSIGTYDISIASDVKCTALPKHPATQSSLERIKEIESKMPLRRLIEEALTKKELILFGQDEKGRSRIL